MIIRPRYTDPAILIDKKGYPRYYENTHIEALEAKKMMDMAGYAQRITALILR